MSCRERTEAHETHICRDCGAEITLPYVRPDESLEGYWERAYWRVIPNLVDLLTRPQAQPDPDPLYVTPPDLGDSPTYFIPPPDDGNPGPVIALVLLAAIVVLAVVGWWVAVPR